MAEKLLKRSEVNQDNTWRMEDIFADLTQWEKEFHKVEDTLKTLASMEGHLGESAKKLKTYLDMESDCVRCLDSVYSYASLNSDLDMTNGKWQGILMKAQMLYASAGETLAFSEPEIMDIPKNLLEQFMKEEDFTLYLRFFHEMERNRKHVRSKEIEQLLGSASNMASTPSNTFSMFNNADAKFETITGEDGEPVQVTHGRYGQLMESKNRQVRKDAFMAMHHFFEQYNNTLAANFTGNIQKEIFFAKAKGFSSTRAMKLNGGNIPEEVYDNLITAAHDALPSMYRYVGLRKKMLGVEELHMYDVYVPIVPDMEIKVSFEEAKETILKALAPLGQDYTDVLKEAYENHWIDSVENEGKRSGAYCAGVYGTHPFVLQTYQNTLDNMFTLIHELGHAMHTYYSQKNQPFQTSQYLIFVAEVASTCNEVLLTKYLLANTDDKMKKAYIINHFLDGFKGTFYRQTMFAEFEMLAHRGVENQEAMNAERYNEIYKELNKKYFGPEMVNDDEIAYEWSRIPHFYTPFYVYQYATGISAAVALADRILTMGDSAVADYKKFLSGGGSMDPMDLLKLAGVDMSQKQPVLAAAKFFDEMLTELETILS